MDIRPPATPAPSPLASQAVAAILTFVLIVTVLYLGRDIIVPLVLAVLLAFALGPVVSALRRARIPHIAAIVLAVLAAIVLIGAIAYTAVSQLIALAADLPRYQATISEKLRLAQETFGGGQVIDRLVSTIERVGAQIEANTEGVTVTEGDPIPVVIADDGGAFEVAQSVLLSIVGPLASILIVTIFLIFLLLEREELRDRFLKLVSRGDLRSSTEAMNEASERVGRYLLAQAGVNMAYGVLFGVGLFLIGVPNAILWGLLATIFRYIPFVGTLIIASIPILLSIAVDPGWSMLVWVIGLYLALEAISNNFVEPRLYGNSTGVTPLAVLVAAMFWATLWGPIGLIVSMPLTVCIVVMARYVPGLGFIETMLGSAPVLLPHERFYQRLIAGNVEEASELADREIEDGDIARFYDEIAVPALRLAEADIAGDLADPSHRHRVVEILAEVIENLEGSVDLANDEDQMRVLVFGGKTELDQAMALMVAERVRAAGFSARVMAPVTLRKEGIAQIDLSSTEVACLCYLGAKPEIYARYAARRLKRIKPEVRVIAGYFHPDLRSASREGTSEDIDIVAHTIALAEGSIAAALGAEGELLPGPVPSFEETRMAARALSAQAAADPDVARTLRRLARSVGATVAMVTVVPREDEFADGHKASHAEHLAREVLERKGTLIIEDLQHSPYAHLRSVVESGVRAYAGVPVMIEDRQMGAVLAVFDQEPRLYEDAQVDLIEKNAQPLATALRALLVRREAEEKEAID